MRGCGSRENLSGFPVGVTRRGVRVTRDMWHANVPVRMGVVRGHDINAERTYDPVNELCVDRVIG